MKVFDRIGETIVNLFSGKKGIILIFVIIVSAGVWKYQFTENKISDSDLESAYEDFKEEYDEAMKIQEESGISDSELPPEIQFSKYIWESGLKMLEADILRDEADRIFDPGNYSDEDISEIIEIYKKRKELLEKAREGVLKAKNVADNDLRIKYADYLSKKIEYMILAEETRIKGFEAILNKDSDLFREYLKERDKHVQRAIEWTEKWLEIYEKMKEEGMI